MLAKMQNTSKMRDPVELLSLKKSSKLAKIN